MADDAPLGAWVEIESVVVEGTLARSHASSVATEAPVTLVANDIEIATLSCTPSHLREFTTGFLFTSGLIKAPDDLLSYTCDERTWTVWVDLRLPPDPEQVFRRLYTSGCGKGVMYSSTIQILGRAPLIDEFSVPAQKVHEAARWLQGASVLHKSTGGVHTAALSEKGEIPRIVCDDIGRHNAVDKVIGMALLSGTELMGSILLTTGRVSSEIVYKARRGGIPVVVSRGAPTHQAVLLSRDMNLTLVGFAKGSAFTLFSAPERILYHSS